MASGAGTGFDVDVHGDYNEMASFKSRALQTQESYQLQLALALRLSSQAASADDPNFLDFKSQTQSHDQGVEPMAYRFWVNGSLSYSDKIPDGFYLIDGLDPYAWNLSTDPQASGRVPSLETLKAIHPRNESSVKVVVVDKLRDSGLMELQNWVLRLSSSSSWTTVDLIFQLANLVCSRMGGVVASEEELAYRWKECSENLSDRLGSVVVPIGYLFTGLCVHRAVLFKILADLFNLPCRIVKGCKYCSRDAAASCLVQFDYEKEYLVDLLEMPGVLSQPDSSLNSALSISVSSPLCHPKFKSVKTAQNFQMLAKHYFIEFGSLSLAFDDNSSGARKNQDEKKVSRRPEAFDLNYFDRNNTAPTSLKNHEIFASPFLKRAPRNITDSRDHRRLVFSDPILNLMDSTHLVKDSNQPCHILPLHCRDALPEFSNPWPDAANTMSLIDQNEPINNRPSREFCLGEEGSHILWDELALIKKIGSGSFGTVYHAKWRGSDVAVKVLKEQDFHAKHFKEFLEEVAIMKRLQHPNIVSFIGAITQPPNFSIVTEYLKNGCLYKLLRRPDAGVILDERLRLNMAYDVAKGMNYLHQLQPPIVHRDLKSPNLLVDSRYTVKVCDFGLSRSKANTFLSSKTAAGTPEWMAPEVLRAELSNEKSDVYSFGVILWELMTLQQPWSNLKQLEVVGEVGFKNKRLEIPTNVHPQVATLIEICWASELWQRPSFSYIMEALQQLITTFSR
ncbi:serine/threonine-protein kinase CTR1-like [Humulus lupulus]|uniref:serine/threonine-protein kinase CTR1-like n=1 Tax=Humulus lupulus TaxID=3486 RepID=UPI002B407EFE|nr:serine/threonine-protein kinase CTR1-like [Humulus lupulus]XP_062091877.1 serine/threonine-protein kinase CTR1-like [Humulus lupulus]XP_062091878.1 serine/threonine-protein kinase CTR1-like [Humulus lupulus]